MLLTLSKNNVLVNFLGQDIYESLMEMVLSRYFNAEIVIETEITNAISGIIAVRHTGMIPIHVLK